MRIESVYGYGIQALATKLGTTKGYVYQIAQGRRKVSPLRAKLIQKATRGKIRAADLRPDIFGAGA